MSTGLTRGSWQLPGEASLRSLSSSPSGLSAAIFGCLSSILCCPSSVLCLSSILHPHRAGTKSPTPLASEESPPPSVPHLTPPKPLQPQTWLLLLSPARVSLLPKVIRHAVPDVLLPIAFLNPAPPKLSAPGLHDPGDRCSQHSGTARHSLFLVPWKGWGWHPWGPSHPSGRLSSASFATASSSLPPPSVSGTQGLVSTAFDQFLLAQGFQSCFYAPRASIIPSPVQTLFRVQSATLLVHTDWA